MEWNQIKPRSLSLHEVVATFNKKAAALQRPDHVIRMELCEDFIHLEIGGEVRKVRDKARPASEAMWRLAAIGLLLPISTSIWGCFLGLGPWQICFLFSAVTLVVCLAGIRCSKQLSADFTERVHTQLRRQAEGVNENPARVLGSLMIAFHAIRGRGMQGTPRLLSGAPHADWRKVDDFALSGLVGAMSLIVNHYERLVAPSFAGSTKGIEADVKKYVHIAAGYSPLLQHFWERDLVIPLIMFVVGALIGGIGIAVALIGAL